MKLILKRTQPGANSYYSLVDVFLNIHLQHVLSLNAENLICDLGEGQFELAARKQVFALDFPVKKHLI